MPFSTAGRFSIAEVADRDAAVVLQRAHGRDQNDDVGSQPGLAALDVDELLRTEIGAESRPR